MHRNPPHLVKFAARRPAAMFHPLDPSPEARRAHLVCEARRLARRCTLALHALKRIHHSGRVHRADVPARIDRAKQRAMDARIEYLRAIDRLWLADASEEAMAIFREQRAARA